MTTNPAIVVTAFNRGDSLKRLLGSIAAAIYPDNQIELIISIDKSEVFEVAKIAEEFIWIHGSKKIIGREEHLGLKKHILLCGDLSLEYGTIIMLEDDLFVSPFFYQYSKAAYDFYKNETSIAGISLYNYQVTESCFYPFKAIDDGSDVYFMQVASSWGQLWTKEHWKAFKNWFVLNPEVPLSPKTPDYLKQWGEHSWKKHFIHYLIENKKYFVFPRLSLTTNFEEEGTNSSSKNIFQVPLQLSQMKYNFQEFGSSKSVYDSWFEITPESLNQFISLLKKYNYGIDLYETKEVESIPHDFILSSKQGKNPIASFGNELFPLETNVALNNFGHKIGLFKISENVFQETKLPFRNFSDESNLEKENGISIVIPVKNFNADDLKRTLDSILYQEKNYKECIIVTNEGEEISRVCSIYNFNIRIIQTDKNIPYYELIKLGFKHSQCGILTWISSGNSLALDAFEKVNSVFKSNWNINWISGIKESWKTKQEYDLLNADKYRMVQSEIYNRLKNNSLDTTLELNFFRRNCLQKVTDLNAEFFLFFFQLLENFQFNVAVYNFYSGKISSNPIIIPESERIQLINKYIHLKKKRDLLFIILELLTIFPLFKKGRARWYYYSLHSFPDVLRYDEINHTFYLSKY